MSHSNSSAPIIGRFHRGSLFVAAALFAAGALSMAALFSGSQPAEAARGLDIDGVWVGTNGAGEQFVQTFVTDKKGKHLSFNGASVNVDFTFGGLFPGVREAECGTRGEGVRIARDTYLTRSIDYGVVDTNGDGVDEIAYIMIFVGEAEFEDDTASAVADILIFDPGTDADNDGLPDADSEPDYLFDGIPFTFKRLGV